MSGSQLHCTAACGYTNTNTILANVQTVQFDISGLDDTSAVVVFNLPNNKQFYTVEFLLGKSGNQISIAGVLFYWGTYNLYSNGLVRISVVTEQVTAAQAESIISNSCNPLELGTGSSPSDPRVDCILFWMRWAIGDDCYTRALSLEEDPVEQLLERSTAQLASIKAATDSNSLSVTQADAERWRSLTNRSRRNLPRRLWERQPWISGDKQPRTGPPSWNKLRSGPRRTRRKQSWRS